MTLLIQPSYGNPQARRHWRDTLDQAVDFTRADRRAALTQQQLSDLSNEHPNGRAHFWGAVRGQDKIMAEIEAGDVVLFTGRNEVRGVGEIGVSFVNDDFADTLWEPHPDRGSWGNAYSLRTFMPTAIPYQELRKPLGSSENDNFMGLRAIRDEREQRVLDALGIVTVDGLLKSQVSLTSTLQSLDPGSGTLVVAPERSSLVSTSYARSAAEVLVRRVEAVLVDHYKNQLPADSTVGALRCASGVTDLFVTSADGSTDLIEAKSRSDHLLIRQALGQILDYANAVDTEPDRLSVLVPSRPESRDVDLLHRYGIDCIFRRPDGRFDRLEARSESRSTWRFSVG